MGGHSSDVHTTGVHPGPRLYDRDRAEFVTQNYLSKTGQHLAGFDFPLWRNQGVISPKEFETDMHSLSLSLSLTHTHTNQRVSVGGHHFQQQ